MNAPRFNRDFVKAALVDRAEDLFREVWGEPERAAGRKWRAKASSAVVMIMQGPDRGLWTDHRTGDGGDLFELIARQFCGLDHAKSDFPRVLAAAAAWAGLSPDAESDREALKRRKADRDRDAQIEAKAEADARAALVELIKDHAQAAPGSPAEAYLKGRGIDALPAQGIAYAPPLKPQKALLHPRRAALIAWATDGRGKITGGQRILIEPDGSPAPEKTRKPAFGQIQGHPARFPAKIEGEALYVCEGPETALTVWAATGAEVWAVFGSSGWQAAPLPMGRQIILCPDRDAEGSPAQIAFAKAVAHHVAAGLNVWIATTPQPEGPPDPEGRKGEDLNDLLRRAGIEAVRDALAAAQDARPKPYHPAPEGDRAQAIAAHGETVRTFFAEALPLIRATKQVQTEAEGLDPGAPNYRRAFATIRARARDYFKLDVLPGKTIGKAQKAPRVMLTGAQGVGKTRALIKALTDAAGVVSLCLFPTHEKAAEACRDYTEASRSGPVALHLKGRSAQDPARPIGTKMCLIPEAAKALAKRGVNVRGTLCERCPLADHCGYIEQERELKRLAASPEGVAVFAPHDYAFLPLPGSVKPDLIAFDEAPREQGVDKDAMITLDALGRGLTYEGRARVKSRIKDAEARADALADELSLIRPAMIALRDAWQADRTGARVYAELISKGWTADRFRNARGALSQFEAASIAQDVDAAAWATQGDGDAFGRKVARLAENQQVRITQALGRLFDAVAHEIEAGLAAPVAVVFEDGRDGQADALRIAYVKSPTFSDHAPFLHLDGTGDHDMAEAVFGPMRLERHRVERLATVTQVIKTFSNQSITGKNKRGDLIGGNLSWQAPALRRDLIAFAHAKPSALVVGNKGVIEALKAEGLKNPTAHFGDLRGRNDWEDLAEVILVGREQPSPQAVELKARAFASQAGVPFQPIGAYSKTPRALRMRDAPPLPIEILHHPDPWADRVLSQIREAEALQAIDRVRPMFKPVTVYALGELCLDLTVDAVNRWAELKAGGDRIARTIAQAGVLPLSPRDAERLLPQIWTRSSADRELKPLKNMIETAMQDSAQQVSQIANRYSYLHCGTLIGASLIEYRAAPKNGRRAGNVARALVWGPLSEARAKIEAVAGELAAFAFVAEWEPVADALDAAEERAAIQAEAEAVSPQYAGDVNNTRARASGPVIADHRPAPNVAPLHAPMQGRPPDRLRDPPRVSGQRGSP